MTNTALYTRISMLPPSLQNEVMDYVDFLILKHKKNEVKKHPKAGCMQGTFIMREDFNDSLDDFKDYM